MSWPHRVNKRVQRRAEQRGFTNAAKPDARGFPATGRSYGHASSWDRSILEGRLASVTRPWQTPLTLDPVDVQETRTG
ncbi:hypothetical protein GCM10010442_78080 [Kitasatospora kifunensis]